MLRHISRHVLRINASTMVMMMTTPCVRFNSLIHPNKQANTSHILDPSDVKFDEINERSMRLSLDNSDGGEVDKHKRLISRLRSLYTSVSKLEKEYRISEFFSSSTIGDAEFDSNATVLFLGSYSTGKTTMIRDMIGKEYIGMNIGM